MYVVPRSSDFLHPLRRQRTCRPRLTSTARLPHPQQITPPSKASSVAATYLRIDHSPHRSPAQPTHTRPNPHIRICMYARIPIMYMYKHVRRTVYGRSTAELCIIACTELKVCTCTSATSYQLPAAAPHPARRPTGVLPMPALPSSRHDAYIYQREDASGELDP